MRTMRVAPAAAALAAGMIAGYAIALRQQPGLRTGIGRCVDIIPLDKGRYLIHMDVHSTSFVVLSEETAAAYEEFIGKTAVYLVTRPRRGFPVGCFIGLSGS